MQDDIVNTAFGQLCLLLLAGIAVHLVYLVFNYGVATAARLLLPEFKAHLIMCSQKTLPVAVTIIGFLKEAVRAPAFSGACRLPPCVTHAVSLFGFGTFPRCPSPSHLRTTRALLLATVWVQVIVALVHATLLLRSPQRAPIAL